MNYYMPSTVEELTEALKEKDCHTYLCAGATDLMIALRADKVFHFGLIDLTHLQQIKKIEVSEHKVIIGAAVTMTELEKSSVIQKEIPALAAAASLVGSTQIRNRATIGGNAANASQSADTLPVLLAYHAVAVIIDETGKQTRMLLEDLIIGREKTGLKEKEAILLLEIEKSSDVSAFAKVGARQAVTISKINGCMKANLEDGVIRNAVVYLGAVGLKASSAPVIEKALLQQKIDQIDEEILKKAVYEQIEINIPDRPSKHYKKSAAFGVMSTILEELRDAGKEVSLPCQI